MAGESKQIAEFLQNALNSSGSASLVDAIAQFDFHNHAFPSLWQVNKALSELLIPVTRTPDSFNLNISSVAGQSAAPLSESDMTAIVEIYRRALRVK